MTVSLLSRLALTTVLWCCVNDHATAQSTDEAKGGGTFNTPGYSPAQNPRQRDSTGGNANTGNTGASARNPLGAAAPALGKASPDAAAAAPDLSLRRHEPLPIKPSEFQKFVEASTGRLLPTFGGSFFAETADGFSAPDNVPVSADYALGPGDEVILRAWGSIDVD